MRHLIAAVVLLVAPVAVAQPKSPPKIDPANPLSSSMKIGFDRVKGFILAAADEIPPADYSFKPTPDVRSFGQLIGHVADASYMFCGAAKKDAKPPAVAGTIEKTMTSKDALKKALADALAYCDAVYAASTDAALQSPIDLFKMKMIKFNALDVNVAHDNEHYGNIVTYLRLKKLVPPSSSDK